MMDNTLAPRRRPIGVTIIAVLEAIGGVLEILAGILLLNASSVVAIVFIILGIIALALAWGLWTLKPWAFWVAVVLEALTVVYGIYLLITGNTGSLVQTIIALAILIYLFADRNVRAAFRT